MTFKFISTAALSLMFAFSGCSSETAVKQMTIAEEAEMHPDKFESDSVFLDYIQKVHFNYMWEGAEPNSGLARERIHLDNVYPENDQNIVTTGGSGFGVAGLIVGMETRIHFARRRRQATPQDCRLSDESRPLPRRMASLD